MDVELGEVGGEHLGQTATVTGRVERYPEAGHLLLVPTSESVGPTPTLRVDRSRLDAPAPRGKVISVTGTVRSLLLPHRRCEYVIRATDIDEA